jgi:hypothetical protein
VVGSLVEKNIGAAVGVEETVEPSEIATGASVDVTETEGFTTGASVDVIETYGFPNRPGDASDGEAIDVTETEGTKGRPGDVSDGEAIDETECFTNRSEDSSDGGPTGGIKNRPVDSSYGGPTTRLDNTIAIGTPSPDYATVTSSCTRTSPFPISKGTSPFPISTEATFCLQGNFSKGEHPPINRRPLTGTSKLSNKHSTPTGARCCSEAHMRSHKASGEEL